MSQPYIGEVRLFAGNFAPVGWLFCDGRLLQIAENENLFQLIGTTYGGDGEETYAVPDLRTRVPIGFSAEHGLGAAGGVANVRLTRGELPVHRHALQGSAKAPNTASPSGAVPAAGAAYAPAPDSSTRMAPVVQPAGGGRSHVNSQPYLAVNFIIALEGIYPSQA